jgi:hypothetical protein
MVFLTNEADLHPKTAALTMKLFDAFNWWENDFFPEFRPYKGLLSILGKLRLLAVLSRILEKDICRNMRDEPNIYTYRTPDYMLSTAQDHRAGFGGDQHHIWQATLGLDAVCFTTHPAKIEGLSPNYWSGSGILPRAAQYKNLTIVIYYTKKIPALYVPIRFFFTHAWLPKDKFDDVSERKDWIFARKADGYLALRSQKPYFWNKESDEPDLTFIHGKFPEDMNREIIADGAHNIWICQMGSKGDDGGFEQFIDRICSADLTFRRLEVEFQSPGNGLVRFGWDGPLSVDGVKIPLQDYPRYDNPYVQAKFDSTKIRVSAGDHQLDLNWESGERVTS